MDIATRYQPRARTGSYRDLEGNTMPEDSGGESESNLIRRKFQRTTTDPEATASNTFRKPSLPASATRTQPSATEPTAGGSLEHRPSLNTQRRRSTLRENVRVPSGPRAFPSSPGKQKMGSTSSTTPSVTEATNTNTYTTGTARGFRSTDRSLHRNNAETLFHPQRPAISHARTDSFGKRTPQQHQQTNNPWSDDFLLSNSGLSTPVGGETFEGLPDVNFDDFQTTIKNYDGTSPLLSDFPAVDGGRILPKEESSDFGIGRPGQIKDQGLSRTQSLRQRLAGGRQASGGQQQAGGKGVAAIQQPADSNSSLRNRRQSSITQATAAANTGPAPAGPGAAKPPRKSVGPGLITNMMKGTGTSQQQQEPQASTDSTTLKPALARNSSLTSKTRRITMQPSASAGAESLPRISTLTATTQARQNKVKSLQPPPRDGNSDPNTTPSKSPGSGGQSNVGTQQQRANTPTSSGNRRQSMAASGRASGLGARTISPTDARRIKRMSMMQPAPPMPMPTSNVPLPKGTPTPTPGEEMPNPMATAGAGSRMPELPRLAQPSPSLIPRKTSTPNSARASPDGRQGYMSGGVGGGGVSLSSKPSYSSIFSNSGLNGSTSRLPTPKPRINTNTTRDTANLPLQSSSSMAQYGDGDSEQGEFVPPVPAIPKAYESPKDLESAQPFFSGSGTSLKGSSQSAASFSDTSDLPAPRFLPTPRTSLDVPGGSETPRKRSGELSRPGHKRTNTLTNSNDTNDKVSAPPSTAPPRPTAVRAQPDPNGRKNANLQPLRLPPLNLMPINTRSTQDNNRAAGGGGVNLPRPSQEVDTRDFDFMGSFATPEPKRNARTPSTPMTASKATFFSRSRGEEQGKALRSSSSHYALRDVLGMDEQGNFLSNTTRFFWDEGSDAENSYSGQGVPVPGQGRGQQQHGRGAITPFASGSLPKNSGEFARLRGRPSGEYPTSAGGAGNLEDEFSLGGYEGLNLQSSKPRTRAQTNTTVNSAKSAISTEMGVDSPTEAPEAKKESAGSGLRRKLSLGWRRSSSKAGNKSSPRGEEGREKERSRLQKRNGGGAAASNEMPPPKLPASATWSGDVPSLPSSARPSLDTAGGGFSQSHVRRKSQLPASVSSVSLVDSGEQSQPQQANGTSTVAKTRSQHTEQPTPVMNTSNFAAMRASSWGNLRGKNAASASGPQGRHKPTGSTVSAMTKDKDDLTADDEMQRLSKKRKDVDTAARETEDLKKRAVARSPVSAEHVLHDRNLGGGSGLNVFERGEIVDYEQDGIFFTGARSARKIIGSLTPSPQPSTSSDGKNMSVTGGGNNFGYDDERGDYNIVLGDHLAYRYEVVDVLGKGSFGQVVRCVDHKDGCIVAVKIIRNKKRFHQQALVEVGILGRLREWDPDGAHATLSLTTSFYFRSHLCIVTPCLSINLYELIRAHNFVGFSLPLIRRFSRQLLACLTLLQTKRIIHCDLKPENILLCEGRKADVRVIDFGSSCREEEKVYTYIQSRFYRSPEVILGSSYGLGIDMWSLGCILAELWTGYPLFPGENEQEQLACIMEIFGPPDRHLVERCTRKKLFFDSVGKPRVTVSSKGRRRRPSSKTLQQALKTEDEAFVDFITRCLRWDPERRIKPSEAIQHPFVTNQPFHQRPGIPDEARRAARVRSTAAAPATSTTNGQAIPSPVKRGAASSGNAFAQTATPARERSRPLPETPQTALRNGIPPAAAGNQNHGSPTKVAAANRRHSAISTAGAAAMAGSKRASNGALLGTIPGVSGPAPQQQRGASGNLAQIAARESMGAASGNVQSGTATAARWRA